MPKQENYDDQLDKQRKSRPVKKDNGLADCTFHPNIHSGSKNDRSVDDLFKWEQDKRFKLANQRLRKLEGDEYRFEPEIDSKSKKMAGGRFGEVEDRLMQAGIDRQKKLEDLHNNIQNGLFKPQINLNSKRILERKDQSLFKLDNGKTINLDFYEAVPKRILNPYSLSPKKARKMVKIEEFGIDGTGRTSKKVLRRTGFTHISRSKSRSVGRLTREGSRDSKAGKRTARKGKKGGARGSSKARRNRSKSKEFGEDYVSPYNKTMLVSGLPLKTIIRKTKAIQNKAKKGKKGKGGRSGSKTRGASRSLSKSGRGTRRNQTGKSRSKSRRRTKSKTRGYGYGHGGSNKNFITAASKRSRNSHRGGSRSIGDLRSISLSIPRGTAGQRVTWYKKNLNDYFRAGLTRCEKYKKNESALHRRNRLFDHRGWAKEISRRNKSTTESKLKKLIYKDMYDANHDNSSKFSSFIEEMLNSKEGDELQKKKRNPINYHPRNDSNEQKRRMRIIGDLYMYQSIDENMPKKKGPIYGEKMMFNAYQ